MELGPLVGTRTWGGVIGIWPRHRAGRRHRDHAAGVLVLVLRRRLRRRELRHRSADRGRQRAAGCRRGTRPAARARAGRGAGTASSARRRASPSSGRGRALRAGRCRRGARRRRAAAAYRRVGATRLRFAARRRLGHHDRALETAMDESTALAVTAVRAIETADRARDLWTDADRSWASRAAAEVVGEAAPSGEFIGCRAQLALARLRERGGALARLAQASRWRPWVGTVIVVGAFLLGLVADGLGGVRRINILYSPVLPLVIWNLAVYALLATGFVTRYGEPGTPGPLRRTVAWLAGVLRRAPASASAATIRRRARRRTSPPTGASRAAPLYAARAARILHVAAAALAGGVIAGLYVRGIAFEYRATWESTFLDADTVRAIVAVAYAPGALLVPFGVPDVAHVAAIRAPASENAAPWLHLMAATLLVVAILPRVGLALWSAVVERHRAAHVLDDLSGPYFARLLRGFHPGAAAARVQPFSYEADAAALDTLRLLLARALGGDVALNVAVPVAYGDEDSRPGTLAAEVDTPLIALFNATATPEAEVHGRFLSGLRGHRPPAGGGGRRVDASMRAGAATRRGATRAANCGASSAPTAAWSRCSSIWSVPTPRPPRRRSTPRSRDSADGGRRRGEAHEPGCGHRRAVADLAHQRGQDHAGAHAAGSRRRRGARRAARHHRGDRLRADRIRARRRADALGHAGLRRQRAPRAPAGAGRQSHRLVPERGLGPLSRPPVLADPAGGAQRARQRRRHPLPGQRVGGAGRRRLSRARTRRAGAADKPVLVLLNQMGPPRAPDDEADDVARWRDALRRHACVRDVLALDAFARCWVQEFALFAAIEPLLPAPRRPAFAPARPAWRARRWAQFDAAMSILARVVADAVCARVALPPQAMLQRIGQALGVGTDAQRRRRRPRAAGAARSRRGRHAPGDGAADRHSRSRRQRRRRSRGAHGAATSCARVRSAKARRRRWAASSPARVAGLAADLAAGGLTFGAGMLTGARARRAGRRGRRARLQRGARQDRARRALGRRLPRAAGGRRRCCAISPSRTTAAGAATIATPNARRSGARWSRPRSRRGASRWRRSSPSAGRAATEPAWPRRCSRCWRRPRGRCWRSSIRAAFEAGAGGAAR